MRHGMAQPRAPVLLLCGVLASAVLAGDCVEEGWRGGSGQFVLVTGASSNHYVSMKNMIASARETYAGKVVAWDIGLSADEVDDFVLQDLPNVELRTFNFSAFPEHVLPPAALPSTLHSYAWKPLVIFEMLQEVETVLWIDAGSLVTLGLDYARGIIASDGFFATEATSTIGAFTYSSILDRYQAHHLASLWQAASGYVGADRRRRAYAAIIKPWRACALDRECIAPPGSSRANHRQDQSYFSILVHQAGYTIAHARRDHGVMIHMDTHLPHTHRHNTSILFAGAAGDAATLVDSILFVQQRLAHRVLVFNLGMSAHELETLRDLPSVQVPNPKPQTPDSRPETPNPKLQPKTPKLHFPYPKTSVQVRDPKPETRNPKRLSP
jgi:hypothetical protein